MSSATATTLTPAVREPARDQRMLLTGMSWDQYLALSELFNGRPSVRLTYFDGVLEIMTTGPLHERLKTLLARLLEVYALARGIRLHGYGSTTYRRKAKKRGLEPDECYFVGEVDGPFPHLAIEVAISSGGLDKLPVYAGLGVREVWIWKKGRLTVHRFQSGTYVPAVRSALLPALDLEELARFATIEDQPKAVAAYFARLTRQTTRRAKKARSRR